LFAVETVSCIENGRVSDESLLPVTSGKALREVI